VVFVSARSCPRFAARSGTDVVLAEACYLIDKYLWLPVWLPSGYRLPAWSLIMAS